MSDTKKIRKEKKKTVTIEIKCCADCKLFDDDDFGGVFCDHQSFPKDKNKKHIVLTGSIDVYEEVHGLCPYRK